MNKFEGITILHVEDSDYAGEALKPAIAQEFDTADIVIEGDKVVKNRVSQIEAQGASFKVPGFKNLSVEPVEALDSIAAIIKCGHLLTSSSDHEISEIGDMIIAFAKDYAEAAHNHARNIRRLALAEAPLAPVKIMQGVDMSGVGKRIRESRVSRRMTNEELENAAHLPEGVTSAWESGKAYPPNEAFDKLAKALNTSVTWLLTGRQITGKGA